MGPLPGGWSDPLRCLVLGDGKAMMRRSKARGKAGKAGRADRRRRTASIRQKPSQSIALPRPPAKQRSRVLPETRLIRVIIRQLGKSQFAPDWNFQPNDYQLLASEVPEVSGFALRTLCLPN
jgi:hypothetical protein